MSNQPSPVPPQETTQPAASKKPTLFWFVISLLVALAIIGSISLNRSLKQFELSRQPPPPVLKTITEDLIATDRDGNQRRLSQLKGKLIVLAYTYSRCPRGCAGVAAQMIKLQKSLPPDHNVHFVSLAAWPEIDSPETLAAFSNSIGIPDSAPWWWIGTGTHTPAWNFMTEHIGFEPSQIIPEEERLNPDDIVAHDLRAVLIDPQHRTRSFYALMHPQTEVAQMALEKLQRDIAQITREPQPSN
jgi:protein SCO1/2